VKVKIFYISLICISYFNLYSQHDSALFKGTTFLSDIKETTFLTWRQEKTLLGSPTRWTDRDWMTLALVIAGEGIIMGNDREVFNWVNQRKAKTFDKVSKYFAEPFGSGIISIPILAAMYAKGKWSHDDRLTEASLAGARAFVITAFNVQLLKMAFGRERPAKNVNPSQFHGPSLSQDAFPSGHTTVAFAVASAIAHSYPDKPLVGVGLYVAATLTAYSRIYDGKHWPSDVFAGAILGYFTGRLVASPVNSLTKEHQKMSIVPHLSPNYSGIIITYNFL
jgi:membrane-associated phospholipid phosphatase